MRQAHYTQQHDHGRRTRLNARKLSSIYLDEPAQITWLVDNLLHANGVSVLAGAPKSGKSTLARCLAASMTKADRNWLGRYSEYGETLHLALDERKETVADHYRQIETGADLVSVVSHLDCTTNGEQYALLDAEVATLGPQLVIVDTLQRFSNVYNINDYACVTRALAPLRTVADKYNCHVMLVHHAKKGRTELRGDEVLGSQAIAGSVDTIFSLSVNNDGERKLYAYGRDGCDLEESVLSFEGGVVDIAGTAREVQTNRIQHAILEMFAPGEIVLHRDIIRNVNGRNLTVGKEIDKLVERDMLIKEGQRGRGGGWQYKLAERD